MRAVVGALLIWLLLGAAARAQVINGESTYGDSDLHTPPADASREPDRRPGDGTPRAPRDGADPAAASRSPQSN